MGNSYRFVEVSFFGLEENFDFPKSEQPAIW